MVNDEPTQGLILEACKNRLRLINHVQRCLVKLSFAGFREEMNAIKVWLIKHINKEVTFVDLMFVPIK